MNTELATKPTWHPQLSLTAAVRPPPEIAPDHTITSLCATCVVECGDPAPLSLRNAPYTFGASLLNNPDSWHLKNLENPQLSAVNRVVPQLTPR